MKKLLTLMLVGLMMVTLVACGGHPNEKGIVGVWHVVDEETETDYGLGIEFTKDGKVRYGLTEDVFTALADGDEKAAEDALKALDFLVSMEYKVKSDTEMEITAKALLGLGGKESETITYSLEGDNLTFDDVKFTRAKEE